MRKIAEQTASDDVDVKFWKKTKVFVRWKKLNGYREKVNLFITFTFSNGPKSNYRSCLHVNSGKRRLLRRAEDCRRGNQSSCGLASKTIKVPDKGFLCEPVGCWQLSQILEPSFSRRWMQLKLNEKSSRLGAVWHQVVWESFGWNVSNRKLIGILVLRMQIQSFN